jgi:6-phosphogluconate dehydrogenase (decarboxylating)
MQLGMIGLGRMGANMARRLVKAGHDSVVFDMSLKAVEFASGVIPRSRLAVMVPPICTHLISDS